MKSTNKNDSSNISVVGFLTCWERSSTKYPAANERCGIKDVKKGASDPETENAIERTIEPRISQTPHAQCGNPTPTAQRGRTSAPRGGDLRRRLGF